MNAARLPWLVLGVGVAALAIAVAALLAGRSRGRRRCPRCWYDMSGAAAGALRCPECGGEIRRERDLLRTRRRWPIGAPALVVAVGCLGWLGARFAIERDWHYAFLSKWRTLRTIDVAIGRDTLRIEEREVRNPRADDFARMLVVSRRGERLLALEGFHFIVGAPVFARGAFAVGGPPTMEIGTDITGDGGPDLMLGRSSGGSGGDGRMFVYSLDGAARHGGLEPSIVLPFLGRFEAADPAAGGGRAFLVQDMPLEFRWTSRAESPRADVVVALLDGGWRVDTDRMRRPAPSLESLRASLDRPLSPAEAAAEAAEGQAALRRSKQAIPGGVGRPSIVGGRATALLRLVVDLVYQGNAARARELLDAEWPVVGGELAANRAAFDAEFGQAMRHSRFADALRTLNGDGAWWE